MKDKGVVEAPPETGDDPGESPAPRRRKRGNWLTGSFAIVGPVLQRPKQFFEETRAGTGLSVKIRSLLVTSIVFLAIYGAVLGSGHPILSLGVAIAVPFLFLSSWATCIPVMYLFDVLTGSQRSLAQVVTVLLASIGAAATVFFSFAPIMVVFSLTGTFVQFFWLNVIILGIAALVGLSYMAQGIIQTAIIDTEHTLNDMNRRLHFVWMLLFLAVIIQMAWGLLSFFENTGGIANVLIKQIQTWWWQQ